MHSQLGIWILAVQLGALTDGAIVFRDLADEFPSGEAVAEGKLLEWTEFERQIRDLCREATSLQVGLSSVKNELSIGLPNEKRYVTTYPDVSEVKKLLKDCRVKLPEKFLK